MLSKSHIKYIQSLADKKFRDQSGNFIAEGNKIITALLQPGNLICEELFALQSWVNENGELIRKCYDGNVTVIEAFEMEKISVLSKPPEVFGIFKKITAREPEPKGKITLVLDTIQDPGNMGTIIRIADWFGVLHLVCSPETADQYNPKVVQSSMGSIGKVNVYYTDLNEWLQTVNSVRIYAAVLEGKNVKSLSGLKEGIIIIGNESKGISEKLLVFANEKISIPKIGHAESLNAAVATGIILSHATL